MRYSALNRVANLRTLFELRKTEPLHSRVCVARFFVALGRLGCVDASGLLWPIVLAPGVPPPPPQSLAVVSTRFFRLDGKERSKYDDSGYLLEISAVLESVESREAWPVEAIPAPVPPEDRFHSFKDAEDTRFLDSPAHHRGRLIEKRNLAHARARQFFENRGFVRMETPSLVPSGGVETYLNTFETRYLDHRGKRWTLALPTSPEFALKKLLAEGFDKVFQLSRSFRNNGEISAHHEPEFVMAEWYRSGAGLDDVMRDTEKLVASLAAVLGSTFSLPKAWPRMRVDDLFRETVGIVLEEVQDVATFRQAAQPHSASVRESDDWDSVFCKLFMERIEPRLKGRGACFVTHYPVQMGALAAREPGKPFVLRFEAFLDGIEICNGYEELTDAQEMTRRFEEIERSRAGDGSPDASASPVTRDPVFEKTMAHGLPPCAGNALGLDRVVAVLAGLDAIAPLMPIPFLGQFEPGTVAKE